MKDRIMKIRQESGLTMEQFGQRIGISRSSISLIESGARSPTKQTLLSICREFGVSYDWLTRGEGEMKPPEDEDEAVNRLMLSGTDFQKAVFRSMASLPPEAWACLRQFVDNLKKSGQ